jgi:hypothetical protein
VKALEPNGRAYLNSDAKAGHRQGFELGKCAQITIVVRFTVFVVSSFPLVISLRVQ